MMRLAVAGDAAYNGLHQWLTGSPTAQKLNEWISALDKIESLNPRAGGTSGPGQMTALGSLNRQGSPFATSTS